MPNHLLAPKRLVYMRRTRSDALNLGRYGVVAWLIAGGVYQLGAPKWLRYVAFAVAIYFTVSSIANLLAYMRHKRSARTGVDGEPKAAIQEQEDLAEPDDVVRTIDLGGGLGAVRLIIPGELLKTQEREVESLFDAIAGHNAQFPDQFYKFRQENALRYPEYAEMVSDLKINHIAIYRYQRKVKCIAFVHFKGESGELWYATYDGKSFSGLMWV